ncbi:MAG: molybdopterin-binding protein [Myxococcota bacterium]|nr:molybdopterin-binding protein [Myxococcota bacterium]
MSHEHGHGDAHRGEEAPSVHRHRKGAPRRIPTWVVTVSDTRTLETDSGGALVASLLEEAGHPVPERRIVSDDVEAIQATLREGLVAPDVGAVILTGGTGVAPRDVTPEAVTPLLERVIPGFGELFRMLSYEEIGAAALLSRALAGQAGGRVVFALPGSRGAIRTAMEKLVIPEMGHLVGESTKA